MKKIMMFIFMSTLLYSYDYLSFENFESFLNFSGKARELRLYEGTVEGQNIDKTLKTVTLKKIIYFNEDMTKKRVDTYSNNIVSYSNFYDKNGKEIFEVFEGTNIYDNKGRISKSIVKSGDIVKNKIEYFYSEDGKIENTSYYSVYGNYSELDVDREIIKNDDGSIVKENNKYGVGNHIISNEVIYFYDKNNRLVRSKFQFTEEPITYTIRDISYNSNNKIESIVQNTFDMSGKLLDTAKMSYKYFIINKNAVYVVEYVDNEPYMVYKQEIIN